MKLNTPGERDGVFELWVDGKLEAARTDLDWHGTWSDYAINAVFLENYWNQGSVKRQVRWFDNLVISTKPIGPLNASKPPTIFRTESAGALAWEVQVKTDPEGKDIVWTPTPVETSSMSVMVDSVQGAFMGSCAGKPTLNAGAIHWVRIREVGQADWSPWHMPFR